MPGPFIVAEPLVIFACQDSLANGRSPYNAVRFAWTVDPERAQGRLVLASDHGVIRGAYRPNADGWKPATAQHFFYPEDSEFNLEVAWPRPRYSFHGGPAEAAVWAQYVGKSIPDEYGLRGPFRYCDPD